MAAAIAVLLRLALEPVWGLKLPFITFFPAMMVSAWLGGFGPGITTTLLCAVAAAYFWLPPDALAVGDAGDLVALLIFVAVGGVISGLNEAWHRMAAAVAESEKRLKVTLASIGDAVIATDPRGRVTMLNGVAQALTGWTDAEAAGRPLEDVFVIVNEESRRPAENPVGKVLREGVMAGLANHTVLLSKDGREIPIDDSAAPIRAADGRLLGVVMVFRDITERRQTERERAALLGKERAARTEVEHVAERLRRLQAVTDTALLDLGFEDLIRALLPRVRLALGSDTATILLLGPHGRDLVSVASDGLQEEVDKSIRIAVGRGVAGRIAASEHGLVIDDLTVVAVESPWLREKVKSLVGAPLRIGDRLIGVIHAGSATPRSFTEADLGLLRLVAERAALAVERARLHEAERAARAAAETAARRTSFLAEASQLLAASLEYETTLASLARLAVPRLADLCAVDVVDEDGAVRRLAAAHVDPAKEQLARELRERYPFEPDAPWGVPRVLRTGQAEFLPEVPASLLDSRAKDAEQLRLFRAIGVTSAIVVPLAVHGRMLGAITLVRGESGPRYDAADLALADELAARAALAVDNARLYAKEQAARRQAEEAEQRLRLALGAGGMGTWEWTIAAGKVQWSSSLEAIHGLAPGTFPGTFGAFQKEIHPDDRDRVLRALAEAVEQGREHHVEYRIVRPDGAVRWVEGRGQLFRDAGGRPDRMVGVCSDVTERKQAEEKFRLAVEAAPTAMIMVERPALRRRMASVVGGRRVRGDHPWADLRIRRRPPRPRVGQR